MPRKINTESTKKKTVKKDKNAPKKPLSGYVFFSIEERPNILKEDPNIGFGDISKKLSEKWKSLSENEKIPYINKSNDDKERFKTEMEKYNISVSEPNEEENKNDKKKRKKKNKDAPKKPLSAYLFFSMEERPKITEKDPNLKFVDITKMVAEKWKSLNEKDKAPYVTKANNDKERFKKDMEEYVNTHGQINSE